MAKKRPLSPPALHVFCEHNSLADEDTPLTSRPIRLYRDAKDRSKYIEIRMLEGGIEVHCGNGRLVVVPQVTNRVELHMWTYDTQKLPISNWEAS